MGRTPEANPIDRWTVSSRAEPGKPGEVMVTLEVSNEVHGRLPVQVIPVDWAGSPELNDAHARAVALAAQSIYCLAQRLADRAVALMETGETGD